MPLPKLFNSLRPAYRVCAWLAIAAFLTLVIVQLLFKIECPIPSLVAVWSAGDLIGFVGSIIGAVATILAVTMTIDHAERNKREEHVMDVLPCIGVEVLERRNLGSVLDDCGALGGSDSPSPAYEEVPHGREYAILTGESVSYTGQLGEQQQANVEHCDAAQSYGNGLFVSQANPSQYIPLVFQSIGSGPALDVSLALIRAETPGEVPPGGFCTTPVVQMPVGRQRYFGLYIEDRNDPRIAGGYQVVADYYDILGNQYRQCFPLKLTGGAGMASAYKFAYAIDRLCLKRVPEFR